LDYESLRLENIRRNQEFLATLGLDEQRSHIAAASKATAPTRRGTVSHGIRAIPQPVRRSGRVTIERIKQEIDELKKNGGEDKTIEAKEAELAEMIAKKAEGSYDVSANTVSESMESPSSRLSAEPIPLLKPRNMDYEADEANVARLVKQGLVEKWSGSAVQSKKRSMASNQSVSTADYISRLNRLKLAENDMAKLTEARITSVYCHPRADKILVAAGDKAGYIGLWDVDGKSPPCLPNLADTNTTASIDVDSTHGGVYRYRPHVETVIKLHSMEADPSSLISVSYDGTIRGLDLHQLAFSQHFEMPEPLHDVIITDASFYSTAASSMLVGRSDGYVALIDFRQSASAYVRKNKISDVKLNSVQVMPNQEHYLISAEAGKDGVIMIHDQRKLPYGTSGGTKTSTALRTLSLHSKSINAAYCTPDGAYLVSISQDHTIRVTKDPAALASDSIDSYSIRHDNHTGRWLSTFR
jgi:WD repeat-containing protein 76